MRDNGDRRNSRTKLMGHLRIPGDMVLRISKVLAFPKITCELGTYGEDKPNGQPSDQGFPGRWLSKCVCVHVCVCKRCAYVLYLVHFVIVMLSLP